MKKLLFVLVAVLGLSAPSMAQSFSASVQLNATYSVTVAPGLTAGVLGRVNVPITPDFGLGLVIRPFVRYSTDLVNDGPLNVNAFAQLRLPLSIGIVPSSGVTLQIAPSAGVDATYTVNEQLSVLGGASVAATITAVPSDVPFSFNIQPYVEVDYLVSDALLVYAGTSVSISTGFGWDGLYLGASYDLMPKLTLNPEFSTDFGYFDLIVRLSYRI